MLSAASKSGFPVERPPWLRRYALSVLLYAGILGLSLLLNQFGIKISLTIPIVVALVVTSWYGGFWPGVLISTLFHGTTIAYTKVPSDSSVAGAVFGYLSVFSVYIFLVFMISRMKRVQAGLREHRDMLHVTLASIGDAVIATDVQGRITFINPSAENLLGVKREKAVSSHLNDVMSIVNEETREAVKNPVETVIETGKVVGLANHSVLIAKDGREIPIDDSAAPILDRGEVKGVILVIADVTQRKLAERSRREREIMRGVVDAQEAERRRIARDLHDHLGQRMTGLRLKIEALSEKCKSAPELCNDIDEVKRSAEQIDRDIGFLSWELRPTELENLGLQDALKSFVREWSRQYGIAAEFHSTVTDDLSDASLFHESLETNFFRITQEALNNVVKHAGANTVSVLLQRQKDDVLLIVEDDGGGFDAAGPATNGTGPHGQGVLGMRERAALMGGSFEIDSEPGSGTSIVVRIPVSHNGEYESQAAGSRS